MVVVKVKVFLGQRFDVAVFVPDSAWLAEACRGMSVTSLGLLAKTLDRSLLLLTYIDHHIRFRNALFSGLNLEATVLRPSQYQLTNSEWSTYERYIPKDCAQDVAHPSQNQESF